MSIDNWKRRYTVREFDKNFIPKKEDIDYLLEVTKYIPTQESRELTFWLALGPEDQAFKTWLFENVHYIQQPNGNFEHMYAVASAPWVFTNCTLASDFEYEAFKMQGMQAGILMSEALQLGLDVSTIGCIDDSFHMSTEKQMEFKRMAFEYFGDDAFADYGVTSLDNYFKPSLSVCIGKGLPYKQGEKPSDFFDERGGKRVHLGPKEKRSKNGMIFPKNRR